MPRSGDIVNVNPFELLVSEHAFLRERLRQAMGAACTKTAKARTRDAVQALSRAAKQHMREEEAILYPVGERLFGPYGAVFVLRNDHAAIEAKLSRSESTASRKLAGWLESLAVHLEAHLGREERVLFPMMTAIMSGKEMDRLAHQLRSTILP
jgi:iron-sulfur cluster repair protein YtfE (RIC family)